MHHVIIGNGPAGTVAADTLRQGDPAASITLIGDEPEPPYGRMAIPYFLNDKIDESGTHLRRDPLHFALQNIELRTNRVTGIQPATRQVELDDGSRLVFSSLLIATGSRPNRPPIPGTDDPRVLTCWTLADARQIIQRTAKGTRVALLGAGFIGCIVLEALAARGVALTVIEMAERMVPRMLDANAGTLLGNWCSAKGVKLMTSTGVQGIEAGRDALTLQLAGGGRVEVDLVILATGVRPNLEFIAGSGIETEVGILVDDQLQTSVPGIYAAGDVAQGRDFSTGERSVQAIQPVAVDHGRVAGLNMNGDSTAYVGGLSMNVLDTLGLVSCSFGRWMGVDGGDGSELLDRDRYRYLNLQFQDDVLVGATAIGVTQHIGALRGLIQGRHRLGAWKARLMSDPTRIMDALVGCTALA